MNNDTRYGGVCSNCGDYICPACGFEVSALVSTPGVPTCHDCYKKNYDGEGNALNCEGLDNCSGCKFFYFSTAGDQCCIDPQPISRPGYLPPCRHGVWRDS